MTHDKLLAKINNLPEVIGLAEFKVRHDALLAVVELHRPEEQDHKQYEKCWNCNLVYPCPTIQAIERELTNG